MSLSDSFLIRTRLQTVVFSERPRRSELLRLETPPDLTPLRLRVHRNQPFEFVQGVLSKFAAFAGWEIRTSLSGYDDSLLSLAVEADPKVEVEFLWLDFDRYLERTSGPQTADWLTERLGVLRAGTNAPILVADAAGHHPRSAEFNHCLVAVTEHLPGVRMCPQSVIRTRLGNEYFDDRMAAVTGSALSDAAAIQTARELAFHWLPPAVSPRIKAIAVDLDNTLYDGVLGENGAANLLLTPPHARLQHHLRDLRRDGVFLAVLSRNVPEDVGRMFAERGDFPLRPEDFSALSIGWGSKSDGLGAVAEQLRISPDAILFVDDNPGELLSVIAGHPECRWLFAASAEETLRGLENYPGLHGYRSSGTDSLRIRDLEAANERTRLKNNAVDATTYLSSLGVRLEFRLDPRDQSARLHDLSAKTNQFNLALRRFSESDIAHRLTSADFSVVSVALSDRLADSGVVGVLFAHRIGNDLRIEEFCISCRALGRELEDIMFFEAVRGIIHRRFTDETCSLSISFTEGPRNEPARKWLEHLVGSLPSAPGTIAFVDEGASLRTKELGIDIAWN